MRNLSLVLLALLAVALPSGCSDDDNGPDQGIVTDGPKPIVDKGVATDTVGTDTGGPLPDTGVLPWPDSLVRLDAKPTPCTPEQPGMCFNNYTMHCKNGVCTPCPEYYTDCDRKGDCECLGACDGNKCIN
jgi:hypothetical protein